jgi:hypothetical protein
LGDLNYRAEGAPSKRDLAKRLGAVSPDTTTKQFENPSTRKANIGHDPIDDNRDHGEDRGTRHANRVANDMRR